MQAEVPDGARYWLPHPVASLRHDRHLVFRMRATSPTHQCARLQEIRTVMHRRTFIRASAALAAVTLAAATRVRGEPAGAGGKTLIWRPMTSRPADAPALNGHTDTVPDIIGRIGAPIDLAIFTE